VTYSRSGFAEVAEVLKDLEGKFEHLMVHGAAVASPNQLENNRDDLVAHQSFAAHFRKAGGCLCFVVQGDCVW